jgi:crotonobetainyl-CoA:carnitine CoA-transferase CaiB-like acyl-CoA transferase
MIGLQPLAGIKVVEFTHIVMGPVIGHVLASLGAEVIKVEPLEGDRTRRLKGSGAGYFPMFNRHKASLCVDLKSESGQAVARRLSDRSDVLVENFRPGALDALGLGYEALSQTNPGLIYCSGKGFQPGPYEARPALDEVVQMMGGLAYMTGPSGRPLRAGSSVVDITGGLFGAIGILAALEERRRTGRGQLVVASLFETVAYLVGQHMAQGAVTGVPAVPMPERVSAWPIYDVFETRDRPIFLGVVSDPLWRRFCTIFALDDWLSDETLKDNNQRVEHRVRILTRIRSILRDHTSAELVDLLEGSGLPYGLIGRPEDMFDDPQLVGSQSLEPVRLDDGRETALPVLPLSMAGHRPAGPAHLPQAGADGPSILRELGYAPEEVERLVGKHATQKESNDRE